MRWADWPELVPDPRQVDQSGGIHLQEPRGTSPAIQRRLRQFGRREAPVRREPLRPRRSRPPLRERLRVALGLVLLAVVVAVGRRR